MIEQWQSLLNQLEIKQSPYGSEFWSLEKFNKFEQETDIILPIAIVRTILLEVMKKAAHRIEYKCNATIAPMDSFNQILSGLLETAGHLANPIVSFCWRS